MDNYRTISTPFYGSTAYDIIRAVSGQMSDGLWENSRGYEKYWTQFQIRQLPNDQVVFLVSKDSGTPYCNRWYDNPFYNMSDKEFLAWYAGKLKAVIQAEARDNRWTKGWWRRDNTEQKSIYLNYSTDVFVADVYCVYDILKGRICRSPESTRERCFSKPANEEAVAKREDIIAKRIKILTDHNAAMDALKAKYEADRKALCDKYREDMAALEAAS